MILPALLLVPFTAGFLSYLARQRQWMEAINLSAFALTLVLAIRLAARVLRDGTVTALGGFLYADTVSALVAGLTAFVGLLSAVYAVGYLRDDERNGALDVPLVGRPGRRLHKTLAPSCANTTR